ncbi:kinase-like protein [Hyaloscypha variabilis F]|uniref:non-specific serine/threonine protein kinase n=1 Tax=Hyaloscypha variabilis (strain UAMH 11265 / GT02V1 / F) TaxID=1149755 RepID=A0A2J6RXZ2_HYAVF|nr:kinase-like protein [Hyaloscypha variabilis F]
MECLREKFYDGVVLDGRFETVSPLNHGSFGMVFMAKDLTTNEFVAIKCLTKKSATTDSDCSFAVDERSEELACHARLGSHPNIVNLIHSFETDAHIYIVLEFCSRGDLYEAIRTGTGPLETEHVRQFMLQLVDAVAYIHAKGMYHRDIKPENIFLTQSGEMKLGDFGLATTETWTYETTVGSDRYMSPEQYDSAGAGYAPEKADIWAIGICLLNILFSRNPFTTPTESDPLFLDFSRDKQSLFDVFPTMSQDTYEVIAQCMSLDPRKRSLQAAREALERVVSFTTFDESLDDFCSAERRGIACANREPLRTPSIQSPQMDTGSFPWAKALHASPPQQFRQLSAIPDDESYKSEDLFPSSEESNKDWFSVGQQTPSMASILDSSLASMRSLGIRRPFKTSPPKASLTPISGSLPINMSKPKPLPSMASIFGKKNDAVSKSWSDLWDEDIEEEEEEAEKQLKTRQMQNARTWSHESKNEDDTIRAPLEPKSASLVNIAKLNPEASRPTANDIDSDLVADGFFFHDTPKESIVRESPPRYSPPPKRTTFDKWSALGERRRAYTGTSESEKSPELWKARRSVGLGFTGFGAGVWDNKANTVIKDTKGKGCPWARDRARDHNRGKEKRHGDFGDLEWVGGWEHLHL